MDKGSTYRLGESVLDLKRGTLCRGGEVIALRPRTAKLLGHLAHNAGRVVSKEELLDAIWPRLAVTEDSLTQCIRDARKCVGDLDRTVIRTVSGRGYIYGSASEEDSAEPLPEMRDDLDLGGAEPRIAVLPFRLAGGNRDLKANFDTVVREITTALSTSRALAVCTLSPAMSAALIEASVDYLVEGDVRPGGSHLNVVVTLSEAKTGRRLLTQSFFLKPENIIAFHQAVARQIVSALVFNIETAAWQRTPEGSSSVHRW